ncbi:serine hydrolase domain-containing protein [Pseudohongiella nitratireducens]|uniref:serine hydrolase domain-containing protein n=1 Tax=Pseudohongiella nitratireducens TaxID=1768907 RepID=UPI0030EE9D33|tara:strand:- start:352 stop:1599 length:1248 start_codon:yes stop_codon:yes gene_type:complete
MKKLAFGLFAFGLLSHAAVSQSFEAVSPESVGVSSAGLERATESLQAHIEQKHIAGVVAAVLKDGKLVYREALGQQDIASDTPMPEDALFRIYSMTRPVSSLAAMILWEEGRFQLDDPISQYLPQFADQQVFQDAASPNMDETRPRQGDITVADLMRHTSGLGSRSSDIYVQEQVRLRSITLAQMTDNAARVPLFDDPGTRFRYGISATILGRLVEIWSGHPYDQFLEERVFGPLGMTDTVFWADPSRIDRLATVYRPDANGTLQVHQMEDIPFTEQVPLVEGGVGLLSTTLDFARFSQLFLNGGEIDGTRILKPETVELMMENSIADELLPIGQGGYMAASGWTLGGFAYALHPENYDHTVSQGEVWWDGSAGTRFWIDPVNNMVTVIMAQVSPSGGNGFREDFKNRVYEALLD